jgi:hypothetical protein
MILLEQRVLVVPPEEISSMLALYLFRKHVPVLVYYFCFVVITTACLLIIFSFIIITILSINIRIVISIVIIGVNMSSK